MTEPSIPSTSAAPGGVVVSDAAEPARRSFLGTAWSALSAAIGTVMGLLPHVLHHVTLIARAALVTGVRGDLDRRFGSWKAPAVALAVFAVMFSLSAFVIGPDLTSPRVEQPAPGNMPPRWTTAPTTAGER